jgi:hypothetical protein
MGTALPNGAYFTRSIKWLTGSRIPVNSDLDIVQAEVSASRLAMSTSFFDRWMRHAIGLKTCCLVVSLGEHRMGHLNAVVHFHREHRAIDRDARAETELTLTSASLRLMFAVILRKKKFISKLSTTARAKNSLVLEMQARTKHTSNTSEIFLEEGN